VNPTKTVKSIEMSLGLWIRVDPRNHVLDGEARPPTREGAIFGVVSALHCVTAANAAAARGCRLIRRGQLTHHGLSAVSKWIQPPRADEVRAEAMRPFRQNSFTTC